MAVKLSNSNQALTSHFESFWSIVTCSTVLNTKIAKMVRNWFVVGFCIIAYVIKRALQIPKSLMKQRKISKMNSTIKLVLELVSDFHDH